MALLFGFLYSLIGSIVLFAGLIISFRLFEAEPGDGIHIFSIVTAALWPLLLLPYAATVAAALFLRGKD